MFLYFQRKLIKHTYHFNSILTKRPGIKFYEISQIDQGAEYLAPLVP